LSGCQPKVDTRQSHPPQNRRGKISQENFTNFFSPKFWIVFFYFKNLFYPSYLEIVALAYCALKHLDNNFSGACHQKVAEEEPLAKWQTLVFWRHCIVQKQTQLQTKCFINVRQWHFLIRFDFR
jgi:hypothetical protein